jgi:hypothetical protein
MAAVTVRPDAATMAMGRSMPQRVQPYADAHGMGYYTALPNKFYDFTEDHFPNSYESIHLWANKKWINYQMMQGKSLVDIGAPAGAPPPGVHVLRPSPYYNMELEQVAGYPRYSQDPQPSWNLGESHGISGEVLQGRSAQAVGPIWTDAPLDVRADRCPRRRAKAG